jgi:hypothetical protein
MISRALQILLLVSAVARAAPDRDTLLREKLDGLVERQFVATVRDLPGLADALQAALRRHPGAEDLNVVGIAAEPVRWTLGEVRLDLRNLRFTDLLTTACLRTGLYWGLRGGSVVVAADPVPRTLEFAVDPTLTQVLLEKPKGDETRPGSDWTDVTRVLAIHRRDDMAAASLQPLLELQGSTSRLHLTAEECDLEWIIETLRQLNLTPRQVRVTGTWVAVPAARMEAALASAPKGGLGQEELLALWRQDGHRVLHHQSGNTLSGINMVLEDVEEVIYPTEFDLLKPAAGTNAPPAGVGFSPVQIPGAFETRETGVILNVTPTLEPGNEIISLQVLPELCSLADWIDYGRAEKEPLPAGAPTPPHFPQPVFRSFNATTSLSIRDGSALGQCLGRDPKSGDDILLFLQAEVINTEGTPIRKYPLRLD